MAQEIKEEITGLMKKYVQHYLVFFYSLPQSGFSDKLYFNDISANDGRNIGHKGHRVGNDIDIRYPGSSDGTQTLWSKAMKKYGTENKFVEVLEKYFVYCKPNGDLIQTMLTNQILNIPKGWL